MSINNRIISTGLIGGNFIRSNDLKCFSKRADLFERLYAEKELSNATLSDIEIIITLPNGDIKHGLAFKTTPFDIANSISKGLAESVIIAKVVYTTKLDTDIIVPCDEDDENEQLDEGELWDMCRPLVGNCKLILLNFNDSEAKNVFWHSSSHVLGAAIEGVFGSQLTIGPSLKDGFYYDSYMGNL